MHLFAIHMQPERNTLAEFPRVAKEFALLIAILGIFGVIKLNIWYWKERKRMTPEERKREDDESGRW